MNSESIGSSAIEDPDSLTSESRLMRAYVLTTGAVFALITVAHVWEMVDRSQVFFSDAIVIGLSAGLAVWAWRVARQPSS